MYHICKVSFETSNVIFVLSSQPEIRERQNENIGKFSGELVSRGVNFHVEVYHSVSLA